MSDTDFVAGILNGEYDLSFFLDFPEYRIPGIVSVSDGDNLVPSGSLLSKDDDGKEIRPFVAECEDWVTPEYATQAVGAIPPQFKASLFADSTAFADWLRANTSLTEVEPGKFLVREEFAMPGTGTFPAQYLTIQ